MPESLFNKVAGLRPVTLLKKKLWHRYFPVNFAKFLRAPFLTEHLRWLSLPFFVYSLNAATVTSWRLYCWKRCPIAKVYPQISA